MRELTECMRPTRYLLAAWICFVLAMLVLSLLTSCAQQRTITEFNPTAQSYGRNVFIIAPIGSSLTTDKNLKADSKIDAVWEGFKEAIKEAIPLIGGKDKVAEKAVEAAKEVVEKEEVKAEVSEPVKEEPGQGNVKEED